ncbi:unnamed protein product [Tetraodon nigroviridis]|uniref:(spotted green pufferfish) hypothetical protein n=1 Tax=Tetraodon nigroviridis TaxID=99883 RepID=Q4T5X0_TETNG|nr:unnamed protein product [Tetraodon nigroviridis]
MHRGAPRPPRGPGDPGDPARFPPPASCWAFPGPRSPRGGFPARPPGGPPGSLRGYRGFPPAGFAAPSRGCEGQMWRRSDRFQPGSPAPVRRFQVADCPVEKYFSASMLQDPWAGLQPVSGPRRP